METFLNILTIATPFSTAILIWQLVLFREQYKNDHERSRRENVITLQKMWMEHHKMNTRYATQLIPYLDNKACKNFWADLPLRVPVKSSKIVCNLLSKTKKDLKIIKGEIVIDEKDLLIFRSYLTEYLNLLEVIFTSWNNNIGDKKIIEEEFGKNVSIDDFSFPLDTIVTTSRYLPSIKEYTKYLKDKNKVKGKKMI